MKGNALVVLLALSVALEAGSNSAFFLPLQQYATIHGGEIVVKAIPFTTISPPSCLDAVEKTEKFNTQPTKSGAQKTASLFSKSLESTKKEELSTTKDESQPSDDEPSSSPHTFTGNVSLVSDYRFRGISQTMRHPAIQGGFDYSHTTGFYLGTWASNVDGTTHFFNNTSMEWDFYGGFKYKLFPCHTLSFIYNVGFIYYLYPGGQIQNKDRIRYDTLEFNVELSYKWLSVKYSQSINSYFGVCSDNPPFNWQNGQIDLPHGSSKGSSYIEINANFDLIKKVCFRCIQGGKLSLLLHGGHQRVRHYGHLSYTDWKISLAQEFPWLNLILTYVATDANHDYFNVADNAFRPIGRRLGDHAFVVGVTKTL